MGSQHQEVQVIPLPQVINCSGMGPYGPKHVSLCELWQPSGERGYHPKGRIGRWIWSRSWCYSGMRALETKGTSGS